MDGAGGFLLRKGEALQVQLSRAQDEGFRHGVGVAFTCGGGGRAGGGRLCAIACK